MSRNEDISNGIWSDPDFTRLSPAGKLMYIWSFTNPRCGMAGLYKIPLEFAAFETGLTLQSVERAADELGTGRFVHYIDGVLWVRSRVKHIRSKTTQIARSVAKDVEQISMGHPLRLAFLDLYGAHPWLREQLGSVLAQEAGSFEPPEPPEPREPQEVPLSGSGSGLGTGLD